MIVFFPNSQDPCEYETQQYDYDSTNSDSLDKLEEIFLKRLNPNNWPWWKQHGLPCDSDDSNVPGRAVNLGTP